MTVSPKIVFLPLPFSMRTETISPFLTPNSAASASVIWMCLFATITPSSRSTEPLGPTSVHLPDPAISPDSLIGASIPIERASVALSSTWLNFLHGPRIDTLASSFLGPTTVTLSLDAY